MKFIKSEEFENKWYLTDIDPKECENLSKLIINNGATSLSQHLHANHWLSINKKDPCKLLTCAESWQDVVTDGENQKKNRKANTKQRINKLKELNQFFPSKEKIEPIKVNSSILPEIPCPKETRRLAALSRLLIQTDLSIENWWICLASSYSKAHGDSLLTSVNRIIDSNAMRSVILGRLKVSEGLYSILSELDAIGLGLSTKHGKFSELSSCWNSEQEIVQALLRANDIDNEELKTFKGILALNNDTLKNQANQILNAIFPLQKEINLSSDSIKTQLKNFRKQYESIQIKLSAFNPEDKQLKQKHAESVNALENQLIAIKQVAEDLVTLSNKDDNCKKWLTDSYDETNRTPKSVKKKLNDHFQTIVQVAPDPKNCDRYLGNTTKKRLQIDIKKIIRDIASNLLSQQKDGTSRPTDTWIQNVIDEKIVLAFDNMFRHAEMEIVRRIGGEKYLLKLLENISKIQKDTPDDKVKEYLKTQHITTKEQLLQSEESVWSNVIGEIFEIEGIREQIQKIITQDPSIKIGVAMRCCYNCYQEMQSYQIPNTGTHGKGDRTLS